MGGLGPQGAPAHVAPFAREPELVRFGELQIGGPQIEDLLDAGARIEHGGHEGVIAPAGAGRAIDAGQHGGDLLGLEVGDGPRPRAVEGDAEEALGLVELRRVLRGQEAGQGVEGGQPDVAGGRGYPVDLGLLAGEG